MLLDRRLRFSQFSGGSGGTSRPELSSPKGRSERTLFRILRYHGVRGGCLWQGSFDGERALSEMRVSLAGEVRTLELDPAEAGLGSTVHPRPGSHVEGNALVWDQCIVT